MASSEECMVRMKGRGFMIEWCGLHQELYREVARKRGKKGEFEWKDIKMNEKVKALARKSAGRSVT